MALSEQQIRNLWIAQGGAPEYADVMAKIALRESGGRPKINNRGTNRNGTVDWGLFQVNDIWRRDPVVGPLFKSGAILTPQGATKAAIHILQVQGPKAWATYNPATDAKYIGHLSGGGGTVSRGSTSRAGSSTTTTFPGVDHGPDRRALIAQFVQQGGADNPAAVQSLAMNLPGVLKDTPSRSVTKTSAPVSASSYAGKFSSTVPRGKGVQTFDGRPVAAWIAPILAYARKHGWTGSINSGYRSYAEQQRIYNSGVRPAAKPGTSNHEFTAYPGGAIDVSNASQLSAILQRSPYAKVLVWAGGKDPVHFSHPHNGSY